MPNQRMNKKYIYTLIIIIMGLISYPIIRHKSLESSAKNWMYEQIEKDFIIFANATIPFQRAEDLMALVKDDKNNPGLIRVTYDSRNLVIRNWQNEVIEPHLYKGPFSERIKSMHSSFSKLLTMAKMPPFDLAVLLHDSEDSCAIEQGPILCFSKRNTSSHCVMIPDFEALEGNKNKLKEVKEGRHKYPWNSKKNEAFWRGATTGGNYSYENFLDFPRSKCIQLSLENPQLIDARFTSLCQTDEEERIKSHFKSFFSKPISVKNHLLYKYQITLDGNASTYSRLIWQMHSNCLVFKQSSPFEQWFYNSLIPFVHYIPFAWDTSDLPKQIIWAKEHDAQAQMIVKNANLYAKNNLNQESIYCYLYLVIKKHAELGKTLRLGSNKD